MTSFSPLDLDPRLLRLEWVGEGEPQRLIQKVVLRGSEDSKFLTICYPPTGMSGMMSVWSNGYNYM